MARSRPPSLAPFVRRLGRVLAIGAFAVAALPAQAQAYPDKPLTLVVGFGAGGALDTIMRSIAEEMSKSLGQRVNVDNRAGAGGAIATQYVVSQKPDGYTLLAAGLQLATGPHLNKVAYDPHADLSMIGQIGTVPVLLLAKADSPIRTAADVVALARSRGGVNVGTGGVGTTGQFGALLLGAGLDVPVVHVPFKGGAAALQALVGGEVDLVFDQMSGVMKGLVDGGKIRIVATMQNQRLANLPDVKTASEFGLKLDAPLQGWQGLAVRSGTPAPVVQKLVAAWNAAVSAPSVRQKAAQLGLELETGRSPEAVQKHYLAELDRWGAFIRKHGITAE